VPGRVLPCAEKSQQHNKPGHRQGAAKRLSDGYDCASDCDKRLRKIENCFHVLDLGDSHAHVRYAFRSGLEIDAPDAIAYVSIAMAIKPLVLLPDQILREPSKPVERVDDQLRRFADDMLETMYDAPGIGLAAIQVGEPIRLLVIDTSKEDEENNPQVFINPEIVAKSDTASVYEEGCLSIPDYYAEVERPASVAVKYLDREGKEQSLDADGILATCLQHEIDHLNGVLFIDHISKLKRDMVVKKFTKLARQRGGTRL
jgi:peptide deformylase